MSRDSLLKTLWVQNRSAALILCSLITACGTLLLLQTRLVAPELEKLRDRQADLQQQLRQRQMQATKSGLPISAVARLETDLNRFREMIPAKQKFSDFIGELFSWADQAGLAIDQISYRPKVDPEMDLLSYGLSFAVTGSYSQLKHYIHLLENSSRILMINQIALAGSHDPDRGENIVSLHIQLTTYFQETAQ